MQPLGDALFDLPELTDVVRVTVRLGFAAALGGCLGFERELEGKAAGLRTHMLVALGAALFTVAPIEAGMPLPDVSRIFQGIATGIGFIGAGTILKLTTQRKIKGLTTAATLWLTAAVGMAAGAGPVWVPVIAVLLALLILSALARVEQRIDPKPEKRERPRRAPGPDRAEESSED